MAKARAASNPNEFLPQIAIVIPAYNEEDSVAQTVKRALIDQEVRPSGLVVVDNGSTDGTADIVRSLQRQFSHLHLIQETEKGTGIACNAGFRYAIDELKADIVARTDADTLPHTNWVHTIDQYFRLKPHKVLISGPSYPKADSLTKVHDKILWPLLRDVYRVGNVAITGSLYTLRFAIGHNLAVRSDAFDKVQGFPDTNIGEADEDVELTKRIHATFGYRSTDYIRELKVDTSMRRVRKLGYMGLIRYYWNPATPPSTERRQKMTDSHIDIR